MRSEGACGRGDIHRNDNQVLAGLLSSDTPDGTHRRRCANPRCGRWFLSRQDGDDYCREACDFNDNPAYRRRGE